MEKNEKIKTFCSPFQRKRGKYNDACSGVFLLQNNFQKKNSFGGSVLGQLWAPNALTWLKYV